MAEIDSMAALRRLASLTKPDLLGGLFPKQRAFVEDPARMKAALCTRRAGKTHGVTRCLAIAAMGKPRVAAAYIHLTRLNAKRDMWPGIHEMKAAHNLPCELSESDLEARFPNGSKICLMGADDLRKVERVRGERLGYAIAVIDEPGSFPQKLLSYLIDGVVRPALMDHRGTLVLAGTPAPIPAGTFFEATTERAHPAGPWHVHKWSVLDNPHMPDPAAEMEAVLEEKGWTREHPTFRREWLGEWVRDMGSLVYPYERSRNWVDRLPEDGDWRYTLGIDYGTVDATAFAVWAWRRRVPQEVYLVECWGQTDLIPSDAAEAVRKLTARYRFDRIVGDAGGLGKGYIEEARRRWGLPISPAQKQNKRGYIELLSGELRAGNVKIVGPACAQWIDEAEKLQWSDDDHATEHPGFANHCLDAALYGFREARAWNEKAPPAPLTEEERMVKVAERAHRRRQEPWYAR